MDGIVLHQRIGLPPVCAVTGRPAETTIVLRAERGPYDRRGRRVRYMGLSGLLLDVTRTLLSARGVVLGGRGMRVITAEVPVTHTARRRILVDKVAVLVSVFAGISALVWSPFALLRYQPGHVPVLWLSILAVCLVATVVAMVAGRSLPRLVWRADGYLVLTRPSPAFVQVMTGGPFVPAGARAAQGPPGPVPGATGWAAPAARPPGPGLAPRPRWDAAIGTPGSGVASPASPPPPLPGSLPPFPPPLPTAD